MALVAMTVRLPDVIHERLVEHRRATRVPTAAFVEQAVEDKLNREQPTKPKRRRKPATSRA